MKKMIYCLISLVNFLPVVHFGQCPDAMFNIDSSSCARSVLSLQLNDTSNARYFWDFCPGDLLASPNPRTIATGLPNPLAATTVFDGTNWYAFVVTDNNGAMTRYDFGSSLSNTPTSVNLGNIGNLAASPMRSNIVFTNEAGNWYGLLVCRAFGTLITYYFGNSLSNIPTASAGPYGSGLSYFGQLVNDNGNLYYFNANTDQSIRVLNFGNSILNTPALTTIAVPGANSLYDVHIVKQCSNWYGFGVDFGSSVIYKLDFGTSLLSTPVVSQLSLSPSFVSTPFSIKVIHDGISWKGLVQNVGGTIVLLDFGSDLSNSSPSNAQLNTGSYSSAGFYLGVVTDDSKTFLSTANFNNGETGIINMESPCSASLNTDSALTPAVSFSSSGKKLISLAVTDSLGNANFYLDSTTVHHTPTSDFTFENNCSDQVTLFTDLSSIDSGAIVSWHWKFGDGDSTDLPSPLHTFQDTGIYNVTLVTEAASSCTDTLEKQVHVFPSPSAGFSVVDGCTDQSLQVTDNSTIDFGNINTWTWDFGNGDSSFIQNPSYPYPGGGSYLITLTVVSDSGCANSDTGSVNIKDSPDGMFLASNTCVGQLVQFINQTTSVDSVISYIWDFGDSFSDTIQDPIHTYPPVVDTYPVSLVVISANGCSDTVNQSIKINNVPVASFSYSPLTACENNIVTFSDLSSVSGDTIMKWQWNFGDGFTDTIQNPVHAFTDSGTYTVSLTAFAPTSCGFSTTQNVTVVKSPAADFTYTPVCIGSVTGFTNLSTAPLLDSIVSYFWDFGDGDTSILKDPSHQFASAGAHLVTLYVSTILGCTNMDTLSVIVNPQPSAALNHGNLCSYFPIQFTSTSTVPSPYTIASFLWNFGDVDTSNNTSTLSAPQHGYLNDSTYVISLIVTTNAGCSDTAFDVITIKQSSIPNFQWTPTCHKEIVSFTNLTSPPSLDTAWLWNFGDGQISLLENPQNLYASWGVYHVTLTVTATNGCVSSASKNVAVSPNPVANFSKAPVCVNTPYQFIDSSTVASGAIQSWRWFIPGFDSSAVKNPVYVFPDTGVYIVTHTVTTDAGCTHSVTRSIKINPLPVANFQYQPQYGIPPLNVSFTNLSTGASAYQWTFGDGGQSTDSAPTNLYTDTGRYAIQLIAESQFGCVDTALKSIYIIKPLLDIAIENISAVIQNNHLYLFAEVVNLGTRDITSFKIDAEIDGGNTIQESYSGLLSNGSTGVLGYNFSASFELTPGKEVRYYCIRVKEPNGLADDNPSNNERCSSLQSNFSMKPPYPNPFKDLLNVEVVLPYTDNLTVELFEMTGKKIQTVFNGIAEKGLQAFPLDLQRLAAGVYSVRCSFRDEEQIHTIIKLNQEK